MTTEDQEPVKSAGDTLSWSWFWKQAGWAASLLMIFVVSIVVLPKWVTGQDTSNLDVAGVPMLWVGRIGKIFQFTAGLTLALELIGELRLRYWAARAELRAHGVPIADTAALIGLIIGPDLGRGRAIDSRWNVLRPEREEVPPSDYFAYNDYRRIRQDFVEAREEAHTCGYTHIWICSEQLVALLDNVRLTLMNSEAARNSKWSKGAGFLWTVLFMSLMFLSCGIVMAGQPPLNLIDQNTSGFIVAGVGLGAVIAWRLLDRRWYGMYRHAIRYVANLLHAAHPGRGLYWVAFFLFITGCYFDLMST